MEFTRWSHRLHRLALVVIHRRQDASSCRSRTLRRRAPWPLFRHARRRLPHLLPSSTRPLPPLAQGTGLRHPGPVLLPLQREVCADGVLYIKVLNPSGVRTASGHCSRSRRWAATPASEMGNRPRKTSRSDNINMSVSASSTRRPSRGAQCSSTSQEHHSACDILAGWKSRCAPSVESRRIADFRGHARRPGQQLRRQKQERSRLEARKPRYQRGHGQARPSSRSPPPPPKAAPRRRGLEGRRRMEACNGSPSSTSTFWQLARSSTPGSRPTSADSAR